MSKRVQKCPKTAIVNRNAPICVGCSRLFTKVNSEEEKTALTNWILNGESSGPALSDKVLLQLCSQKVRSMMSRALKKSKEKSITAFFTATELLEKIKLVDLNCCLVGKKMVLEPGHYHSLTIDHIDPIASCSGQPKCWSIENLQCMSHCMNAVKSNESDQELQRWYKILVDHLRESLGDNPTTR